MQDEVTLPVKPVKRLADRLTNGLSFRTRIGKQFPQPCDCRLIRYARHLRMRPSMIIVATMRERSRFVSALASSMQR